ncbi:IS3 family transposase [Rathayibacter tanaceti]|uniref:IS3 family transposase n=1 Tax=Rathayibacter tanaceti TaxID=1671680 RepID=UPI00129003D2|nr:IS3 family transposase [Rathayibacter tanaceti]
MSIMGRQRREFTPEFKEEAVKLVVGTGRTVAAVAREIDVQETTLGRWVKAFRDDHAETDVPLTENERAELARLRRENQELKLDRAFLKKSVALLRPGSIGYEREAFELMHAEKSNFSVTRMVRLLEVSRSGYYAWTRRKPSPRVLRREVIEGKIAAFHAASDDVYGTPRILADLRADGEVISRKTVAAAMRRLGLRGVFPRRWRTTTVTDRDDAYPVDAVKREWDTGALNQVWVGDITYLRTWEGWLYLATVIDAHSRRVLGRAIADHMRADLVEDTLRMAITLRGQLPPEVIFHSDRGTQYASEQIEIFARDNGLTRSMGHTGVCRDNAMAESFFATLKTELYTRRVWPTRTKAAREVGAWIEARYNRQRRHASLDQLTPVEFENRYPDQTAEAQQSA